MVTTTIHGSVRTDAYSWLRERDNPEVIAHLVAENEYAAASLAHLEGLRQEIFGEIKSRIQETDLSAPARRGRWWYGRRTDQGRQYPAFLRWHGTPTGPAEVILDQNDLAAGHGYCGLGLMAVSPDQDLIAYSVDYSGSETFELRFRRLDQDDDMPDVVAGTYYGGAWSTDQEFFFYTTLDQAHRPYRVWRHRLGSAQADDVMVFQEDDERFFVELGASRDHRYVLIHVESSTTSEVLHIECARPRTRAMVLIPRHPGVRYSAQPHHGAWLVVTDDHAPNGRLISIAQEDRDDVRELIPHDPAHKVARVYPFAGHVVVSGRSKGNPNIRVLADDGTSYSIDFDEEAYRLGFGENLEYETTTLRITYESLLIPARVIDVDLVDSTRTIVKETPVPGGYEPASYVQRRLWAEHEGVSIPLTVGYRADTSLPAPTLLYGYGAYESVLDPWFDPALFSLLDRGFVYAIAHVRGEGAMGRTWHMDGKMANKANTFRDFIACAEDLIASGLARPGHLAARGVSAGGLLMGAVTVMRPELWSGVLAEVPFVDAVNTMLDPTIPLTVNEWEEWGNPALAEHYEWMMAYSPYDNTGPARYPAILTTAGLNDTRVGFWEPAKWVARLREMNTGDRPIFLKTDLGTGHSGASGRYDAWHDEAYLLAFLIDQTRPAL
ncbi:MAG: S9 family peptidase [Actinomycetota bacterium]